MSRSGVCTLYALAMLAGCVAPAFACLNTFDAQLVHGSPEQIAMAMGKLENAYAAKPTLENSNDLGVARLLIGKYDDAINLLREAEKKFPGSAKVAANLGTALELKGEDAEALEWIRAGVRRDANEHFGSEWLHARILEAKIAFKHDPKWFEKNRVLALDFGNDEVPVAPEILPIEKGKLKGGGQLAAQIVYQLIERRKFVKPPDPFMGDLYASLGDLTIAGALSPLDGGNRHPDSAYQDALSYGAPHADLIRKRLARYKADLAKMPGQKQQSEAQIEVVDYPTPPQPKRWNRALFYGSAIAIVLASIGITAFWIRAPRRRSDSKA
jgi:hypothetical protein